MGMRPLEIRRFKRKMKESPVASQQTPHPSSLRNSENRVTVHLPNADLLQRKTLSLRESELSRSYPELFYNNPTNMKQRLTNTFVLGMLDSAGHRFPIRRDLIDWGREERSERITSLLAFASTEEMKDETKYFKDQCLMFQVESWKKQYKDIVGMFKISRRDLKIRKVKHDRVVQCQEAIEDIAQSLKSEMRQVDKKLSGVSGKHGREEEEQFWKALKPKALKVEQCIEELQGKSNALSMAFCDELGPHRGEAATERRKGKNKKKDAKRLSSKNSGKKNSTLKFPPKRQDNTTLNSQQIFNSRLPFYCLNSPCP